MIAQLALALASLGGDTPIEPITSSDVTDYVVTPEGVGVCLMIADQGDLVRELGGIAGDEFVEIFLDMQIAYWADMVEQGQRAAFTIEAREIFGAWVDGCQGR